MTGLRGRGARDAVAAGVAVALMIVPDHLPGPETVRVLAAALAFLGGPLWLWRRRGPGGGLLAGCLHLLGLWLFLSWLPLGLAAGGWVWSASLLIPVWVRRDTDAGRPSPWVMAGSVALAAWMAATPSPPGIWSDAPAHLAAVHDALGVDRWMPPDPAAPDLGSDPRFGVAHGVYAALAKATQASPWAVLVGLPVLVAPLWWWGHALLFRSLGASSRWAWIAAAVFTVAGAGGRGFGLWSSAYPGNLAMALAAPALAVWIEAVITGRFRRAALAILALSLTTVIHPFAWWGATVGVLLTGILLLFRSRTRGVGRWALVSGAGSVAVGVLWMLPALLVRGASEGGLHTQVTDALTVGPWFVADPYWLMRWGGPHVLWAIVPALLVPAAWRRRTAFAFGFALMPWVISLNPLVHPLAWEVGSYLSVRLVRFGYVVLVAGLVVVAALECLRGERRGGKIRAGLGFLVGVWLLGTQVGAAWSTLRSAPTAEPGVWEGVAVMTDSLASRGSERFLADPRTSYAIRALGGPPAAVLPVAHASPRDAGLAARLRGFRSLLDPSLPPDSLRTILASLDADQVVLDPTADARYPRPDFGFVYDPDRIRTLVARLAEAGVEGRDLGGPRLYAAADILRVTVPARPGPAGGEPDRRETGVAGAGFRILDVQVRPASVRPGQEVEVEVWMEARSEALPSPHPEWEQVSLRFEGPMREAPGWAAPVGKLVRKFFLERSRRSPARFHRSWFPFDGVHAVARWDGVVRETRRVRIPPWAVPGEYTLQPSVREAPWRTRIPWTDYLRDRDSLSGPAVGTLRVENGIGSAQ